MQRMCVNLIRCQPFKSRVGVDTVVGLKFDFNVEIINALRDVLAEHKRDGFTMGGWLPTEGLWFLEEAIWPYARARLLEIGCELVTERAA